MLDKVIPKTKKIKLLSQGTYGCVFRPGPSCKNKTEPDNYITKIQKLNNVSVRETEISNKIKKIKSYDKYFAPVIDTCDISLLTIADDELKKCEFLNDNNKEMRFESNKIKYVGKQTLNDFFDNKMSSNKNANKMINDIVHSHVILLEGLEKLVSIGIIHYDLKANNVMCQDKDGRPIFIDFGMSIDTSHFEKEGYNYKKSFGIYGPEYGPWCIDICFLTYMSNKLGLDWQNKPVTMVELEKIINQFMKQNSIMNDLLDSREQAEYRQKLISYFKKFDRTTWKNVLDDLLKYSACLKNGLYCPIIMSF